MMSGDDDELPFTSLRNLHALMTSSQQAAVLNICITAAAVSGRQLMPIHTHTHTHLQKWPWATLLFHLQMKMQPWQQVFKQTSFYQTMTSPHPESTPEKAEVEIGSKNDANQKVKTSSIIEEENIMKRCEHCRVWLDNNFDDHIKSCKPSNKLQINRYGYKCKICSFEVKRIMEDQAR